MEIRRHANGAMGPCIRDLFQQTLRGSISWIDLQQHMNMLRCR
jgi:hypothetical protein